MPVEAALLVLPFELRQSIHLQLQRKHLNFLSKTKSTGGIDLGFGCDMGSFRTGVGVFVMWLKLAITPSQEVPFSRGTGNDATAADLQYDARAKLSGYGVNANVFYGSGKFNSCCLLYWGRLWLESCSA
ncbi:MAG: hypothetical protein IRD7MM_01775 [Candidatus Midichloria mitochondrii]